MSVQQIPIEQPLLEVRNLKKYFPVTNSLGKVTGHVQAVFYIFFHFLNMFLMLLKVLCKKIRLID